MQLGHSADAALQMVGLFAACHALTFRSSKRLRSSVLFASTACVAACTALPKLSLGVASIKEAVWEISMLLEIPADAAFQLPGLFEACLAHVQIRSHLSKVGKVPVADDTSLATFAPAMKHSRKVDARSPEFRRKLRDVTNRAFI